jgi:hypothetical protein
METMAGAGCGQVGEIAVKRDGDVFVTADAILDGLGIFFAVDERLPRKDVLGLVEIAVGSEAPANVRWGLVVATFALTYSGGAIK